MIQPGIIEQSAGGGLHLPTCGSGQVGDTKINKTLALNGALKEPSGGITKGA